MKLVMLVICLIFAGCNSGAEAPYVAVVCEGVFVENASKHDVTIHCKNGRSFNYNTYKYTFTRTEVKY